MLTAVWDAATLAANPANRSVTERVEAASAALVEIFELVTDADPDPAPVADYLTEPAQQWTAARVVAGTPVPHNDATIKALAGATRELLGFYEVELLPPPAAPSRWRR